MAKKTVSFESKLQELKEITAQLESNALSLEDSLKMYEKGIVLYRECSGILQETERKVTVLINETEKNFIEEVEEK